jgi:hypothetical protein
VKKIEKTEGEDMKVRKIFYSIQPLSIIVMVILMAGCGGGVNQASPIPSSTLPSGSHPPNIAGFWEGCIHRSPIERMQMNINDETFEKGTFDGSYTEHYGIVPVLGDGMVANDEPIYNASIDKDNNIDFSADVVLISSDGGDGVGVGSQAANFTYTFQGVLFNKHTLKGQVTEATFLNAPDQYDWFMSNDGSACPW